MVIRAIAHGTEDNEHGGENLYRRDPSSAYFKQFNQSIKSDTAISRVMFPPDTTRPADQIALSDRMDEWISRQATLITVARDKQSKTDFHCLVEYDANITEYPVNSYVLFTPPVGRGDKLLPKHRGPYQVIERSTSIYTIENLVDGKRSTTHIHNLRPFHYDPARTSPLLVAQHNEQEFVVESIHGHRGDGARWNSRYAGTDSASLAILGNRIRSCSMSISSMNTSGPTE